MRVFIIPSWYPTADRPLNGVFIREQAIALSKAHDVQVLYLDVLKRGDRRRARRYVSLARGFTERVIEVPNPPLLWQFVYLWTLVRAYRRIKREFKPDVLHCHVAVPAGLGGALLKRLFDVPVVLTEHSGDVRPWLKRPGLRLMSRKAFRAADIVVAVSEWQRGMLLDSFPQIRKAVVVPNAVDTTLFRPSPLPPTETGCRLVFVALLETVEKGLGVLLEAMSIVKQSAPFRVDLTVVGDGSLRPQYEARARELGIEDRVTFAGFRPHDKLPKVLAESHALVMPSFHESQSLAIIEALACGRPVVATRSGGPDTLVNDSNGILVPIGDSGALAEGIIRLLINLGAYDPWQIAEDADRLYSYQALAANLSRIYRDARR